MTHDQLHRACLDVSTLARLVSDEIDLAERSNAWAHAERCETCAARLHAAMLDVDEDLRTAVVSDEQSPSAWLVGGVANAEVERGHIIGRYVILSEIGSGGLGKVYSAFDPELDRKVAIKLLRVDAPHIQGDLMQVRLLREARAMAKLTHPNVVAIYDVGLTGRRVFLAMELVEGLTLRAWVSSHSPSWQQIRDVMVQAGRGLEAAHAAGLIHRDFKPSNVIVTPQGTAKVLDFGLARAVLGGPDDPTPEGFSDDIQIDRPTILDDVAEPVTGSNQLMGTPGYIAPEQYRGLEDLDPRLDQFAFCVTLHEVLYRRRPYRGKTIKALREVTVAGEIAEPPSHVAIPTWLREALLRGLSVEREDRFANMAELLDALGRDQRVRKRQWRTIASAALLSSLLGASVAVFWRPDPPAELRSEVEVLMIEARAAAAKSYFVYPPSDDPSAATAYSIVLGLEDFDGRAHDLGEAAANQLRHEFSETLVRLGDRYWTKTGGMAFATEYYAAALMFDPSLDRAAERVVMTPGQLAVLRAKAAEGDFSTGELLAADSLAALAEPDPAKRGERLAALYQRSDRGSVSLAVALDAIVEQDALDVVDQVAAARKRPRSRSTNHPTADVDPSETGSVGPSPAKSPSDPSDPSEASEASALGTQAKTGDPTSPSSTSHKQTGASKAAAGRTAYRAGKLDDAERLFHQALALDRGNAVALAGLAEIAFDRGQYRDTVKYGKLAIARQPGSARLRLLLGDAYFKVVDYPNARAQYQKAQELGSHDASSRLSRLDAKTGG